MSSHHFVKEDQEPGLLIYNWVHNAAVLIEQLAQWAPKIIVHEQVLEEVLALGIKVDVVLCQSDVSLVEEKTTHQFPIQLIPFEGSFEEVLLYVQREVINRFNVISSSTSEAVHSLKMVLAGLVFYNEDTFRFKIKKGFEKWLPQGIAFTIISDQKVLELEGQNTFYKFEGEEAWYIQKLL